ncbi:MAG: NADH-quinone oxidoreductase subunit J [Segetibacter sp.]
MPILFYISSLVAIIATIMVITRYQPIHALLYLVVSFMAVALIFLSLGAPFMAVLEIIVYAGAIIVLFIFVVMMLNLGRETAIQEKQWLQPKVWAGPSLLALVLLAQLVILLTKETAVNMNVQPVEIKQISLSLYRKYILALELTGFLLMAGIVGAAHIGKHKKKHCAGFLQEDQAGQKSIDESTEGSTRVK